MKINPINKTNFKAFPVADVKVKGIDSCYKLYKINNTDKVFLSDMYKSVKLRKLNPNLPDYQYLLWDNVLSNAINCPTDVNRETILEACNDFPCGIMNYRSGKSSIHLSCITTFPIIPEKKVPYAGQILFNKLFKEFLNSDKPIMELLALKYSPFNPVSKYLSLGFKMKGGDDSTEVMNIKKDKAKEIYEKQKEFIFSNEIKNKTEVDLFKVLNLNI